MSFRRAIRFMPATSPVTASPDSVTMDWFLDGTEGVVHWRLHTNWYLPTIQLAIDQTSTHLQHHGLCHPIPATLVYHSRVQTLGIPHPHCKVLQGPCQYIESPESAELIYSAIVSAGDAAAWYELEQLYERFTQRRVQ